MINYVRVELQVEAEDGAAIRKIQYSPQLEAKVDRERRSLKIALIPNVRHIEIR